MSASVCVRVYRNKNGSHHLYAQLVKKKKVLTSFIPKTIVNNKNKNNKTLYETSWPRSK